MKSKLLKILSSVSPQPVSGQKISSELGVSRVSIWKQIQQLQDLGYPIQSTPKGYFLKPIPIVYIPGNFRSMKIDIIITPA